MYDHVIVVVVVVDEVYLISSLHVMDPMVMVMDMATFEFRCIPSANAGGAGNGVDLPKSNFRILVYTLANAGGTGTRLVSAVSRSQNNKISQTPNTRCGGSSRGRRTSSPRSEYQDNGAGRGRGGDIIPFLAVRIVAVRGEP